MTLHGEHRFSLKQKKFKVTEELKTGPAEALFGMLLDKQSNLKTISHILPDYMATSVGEFLKELGSVPQEETLHLGLTFSFPVEQTALGAGRLLTWTKGFSATGAVGNDIVQLFQNALDKKGVDCRCVALVNDVCFRSPQLTSTHAPI